VHSAQPEIRPGLILFFSRPKTAEAGSAQNGIQPGLAPSRACSATQAATWAWAGKAPWPRPPPGPRSSPLDLGRPCASDGRARILGEQNHRPTLPPVTLASFSPSPSLSSAPSADSSRRWRPEEEVEVAAPPRHLSPARACG